VAEARVERRGTAVVAAMSSSEPVGHEDIVGVFFHAGFCHAIDKIFFS
jgi:hypothetical protein